MIRRSLVLVVVCLATAAAVSGAPKKRITLKSGRVVIGQVVERNDDGIKVKGTIAVVFYPHDQIASIKDFAATEDVYARKLAKLDKNDADARVELGRWAMDRKMYAEAVEQFEAAVKINPKHGRAALLLRSAKGKLAEQKDDDNGDGDVGPSQRPITPPIKAQLLLDEEGIYRIRVAELDQDDRVRVRFRNDAIQRFVRDMRGVGDFEKRGFEQMFLRWPAPRKAKYMIEKLDQRSPILHDILVESDPQFMSDFRRGIWRWVSNSCATTECHGARKGKGGLKLHNFSGFDDKVAYTNFLILDYWHKKNGKQMIRRDQHEQSLLLQYALPRRLAETPHPEEIRPPIPSKNSPLYRQTVAWIRGLKGPKHPEYGIKKLPPHVMKPPALLPGLPPAATQPAGKAERESPF